MGDGLPHFKKGDDVTIKEIREWYGSKPEGKHYQKFLEKELVITIEALNRAHRILETPEKSLEKMLIEDNQKMRKAGNLLAEASLRVIREYDGLHRLAMAVSDWCRAIASEGGREERHQSLEAEIEKKEATILALKNIIAQSGNITIDEDSGVVIIKEGK